MATVRLGALVVLLLCGVPQSVLTQIKLDLQSSLPAATVHFDRVLAANKRIERDLAAAGDEERPVGHMIHMVPRSSDVIGLDAVAGDVMRRNGAAKLGGNFVRIGRADNLSRNQCLAQLYEDAFNARKGRNDFLICLLNEIVKSYAVKYGGGQVGSGPPHSQIKRSIVSGYTSGGGQGGGVTAHSGKFVRIGRYVQPAKEPMTSPVVSKKLKRSSRENRFVRIGRISN